MLSIGMASKMSDEEFLERQKNYVEPMHKLEDEVRVSTQRLYKLRNSANFFVDQIKFCKSKIKESPIKEDFKRQWLLETEDEPAIDLPLNAKAYAYMLFYRAQLKNVEKQIKRAKIYRTEVNRKLSNAQLELGCLDEELAQSTRGCNNMEKELFDPKFVHFMWSDELEGKKRICC